MPRDGFLTIGAAADLLSVTVETVRRYEAAGWLTAERTPGGQRRFRRSEVERLRDEGVDDGETTDESAAPPKAPVPQPRDVPSWEARRANAAANLDVTRSEIERRDEIRRYREEKERRAEAARAQAIAVANAAEAEANARVAAARTSEQRERTRTQQQQVLDGAIRNIRLYLTFEAPALKAEVERFISEHASVGVSIPWIEAEVAAIRERHQAERRAVAEKLRDEERRKAEARSREIVEGIRRDSLLRHGETYARRQTCNRDEWDEPAAADACEAAHDHLKELVKADWTERRIEREVDDILSEWD